MAWTTGRGFSLSECTPKRGEGRGYQVIFIWKLSQGLPKDIRDMKGVTVDTFKAGLDAWLSTVPDQPTIPGRQRAALTNSLIDQVAINHQRL